MKRIFLSLAALTVLCLPGTASADTFTFQAPATAPNNNTNTANPSRSTTASSNPYQGGDRQFDLDHYYAYTWSIQKTNFAPNATIVGAKLTFHSIANWDTQANRLYVSMLDSAQNTNHNAVVRYNDSVNGNDPTANNGGFDDYFAGVTADPSRGIRLAEFQNIDTTASNNIYEITFNAAQLAKLNEFFSVTDSTLAFAFDPDCHFWNDGITFTIETANNTAPVPEPTTMMLLGTGLAGLYARRRRNKQQDEGATGEEGI